MKKIPNYSRYFADENGDVWTTGWKGSKITKKLKPCKSKDGYLKTVFLRDDGKSHSCTVHKIIALAYLGEKGEGQEINHINGIKTDNRPSNLEYCTRSYNCKHSFDTGLQKPKRGSLNGHSKLTESDVEYIRKVAASGGRYYGRAKLAEMFGVSEAHIKDIVTKRRNTWSHVK
jgi:hypothetical protein